MKIAIASCATYPDLSASNRCFRDALLAQGVEAPVLLWNGDPMQAFLDCDLTILRQTWDYQYDPGGYAAWATRLEALGGRIESPAHLAIWNNDKRTLSELASWGVTVPKTTVVSEENVVAAAVIKTEQIVLKPAIGGSGVGVQLCTHDTLAAGIRRTQAEAPGRPIMAQEYLPEIADGELKMTCIEGQIALTVRAVPTEGEFRINSRFKPKIMIVEPPSSAIATADVILEGLGRPLYTRIDGIIRGDEFICTEMELTDPDLFLNLDPQAAEALARAAIQRAAHDGA